MSEDKGRSKNGDMGNSYNFQDPLVQDDNVFRRTTNYGNGTNRLGSLRKEREIGNKIQY